MFLDFRCSLRISQEQITDIKDFQDFLCSRISNLIHEKDEKDTSLLISINNYLHINEYNFKKANKKLSCHWAINNDSEIAFQCVPPYLLSTQTTKVKVNITGQYYLEYKSKPQHYWCQNINPLPIDICIYLQIS